MNTVTLQADAYRGAQLYAKRQNKSVDEVVNNLVNAYFVDNTKPAPKKTAGQNMYSWNELLGMFKPTGKSDKELIDEYLEEKYGV